MEWVCKYERDWGLVCVGEEVGAEVLCMWEEVLIGLERDFVLVVYLVDWVVKRRLLEVYAECYGIGLGDVWLRVMDL